MLSNGTMWDTGSAGSLEGTYALKIATRARQGHIAVDIKRATWRHRGPIRLETYFTFKPEATELRLSEIDVRSFGVLFDIQDQENRWMPHLRYLNALNGEQLAKWQFKRKREPLQQIGGTGKPARTFTLRQQAGKMYRRETKSCAITKSRPSTTGTICASISISPRDGSRIYSVMIVSMI